MDTDTDDDGLDDGVEVTNCIYGVSENICTDPLENDSDLDGVSDYDEIFSELHEKYKSKAKQNK